MFDLLEATNFPVTDFYIRFFLKQLYDTTCSKKPIISLILFIFINRISPISVRVTERFFIRLATYDMYMHLYYMTLLKIITHLV